MAINRSTPPIPSPYTPAVPHESDPQLRLEDWVGSSVSSSDGREVGFIRAVKRTVGGPELIIGDEPAGGKLFRISALNARQGPFSIELPRTYADIKRSAIAVREVVSAQRDTASDRPSWRRSGSDRLPLRELAASGARAEVSEKIGKPSKLVGRRVRDAAGEQIGWVRATREIDGASHIEISTQKRGPGQRFRIPVDQLIPVERHLYVAASRGQILRNKSYSLRYAGPRTAFERTEKPSEPATAPTEASPAEAGPVARSVTKSGFNARQLRRRPVLVGS